MKQKRASITPITLDNNTTTTRCLFCRVPLFIFKCALKNSAFTCDCIRLFFLFMIVIFYLKKKKRKNETDSTTKSSLYIVTYIYQKPTEALAEVSLTQNVKATKNNIKNPVKKSFSKFFFFKVLKEFLTK